MDLPVPRLELSADRTAKIDYRKIQAVSVAAIRELGTNPVLRIDLLMNWSSRDDVPLQVIRLTSTQFDPRSLVSGVEDPVEAVRQMIADLLRRSDAIELPASGRAQPENFEVFETLSDYQREVLELEC